MALSTLLGGSGTQMPVFLLTDTSSGKTYQFTFCSCGALLPVANQGFAPTDPHLHVTDIGLDVHRPQ